MNRILGIVSANFSGTDLGALTEARPVASLPIGGRYRLVDFALSNMVNSSITTVGLITPIQSRSLLDHVGVGNAWSLNRKKGGLFLLPGQAYGIRTAGSRFLLADLIQNRAIIDRSRAEVVAVCAANWVVSLDFQAACDFHIRTGADMTLICQKGGSFSRDHAFYVDADENGEVKDFSYEGENRFLDAFLINRDLLLSFFDWYSAVSHFDLIADILPESLSKMKVYAYEHTGYAGNVENTADYTRVNMDFLSADVRGEMFRSDRPILTKIQDSPPTRYAPGARVSGSLIPSGCSIRGTVENSVLFRNVEIEEGAVVKTCVLLSHTVVGAGAVLENVICDKCVTVRPGSRLVGGSAAVTVSKKQEV